MWVPRTTGQFAVASLTPRMGSTSAIGSRRWRVSIWSVSPSRIATSLRAPSRSTSERDATMLLCHRQVAASSSSGAKAKPKAVSAGHGGHAAPGRATYSLPTGEITVRMLVVVGTKCGVSQLFGLEQFIFATMEKGPQHKMVLKDVWYLVLGFTVWKVYLKMSFIESKQS